MQGHKLLFMRARMHSGYSIDSNRVTAIAGDERVEKQEDKR